MKSLIIKNITENHVNESFLKTLTPHIIEVREMFYNFTECLPVELKTCLINHFKERVKRADGTLMLGEYAPFILGNLFSISIESINKVAFPWFLMYEYSLLLDDLIDKKRKDWQNELLSSQLVLDKSYREFFVSINNRNQLFDSLEKYRNQSVKSMLCEKEWSETGYIANLDNSIILQGRKASLVKFCVSYMFNLETNRVITSKEEEVLDNICAGIQLLDDLTDFHEDFSESRINLLLNTTLKWLNSHYPNIENSKLSNDQLISALILSQSVNTSLEFSGHLLKSINELINRSPLNSGSFDYFSDLAEQCLQKSSFIDCEILKNTKHIKYYQEYIYAQNNFSIDNSNPDYSNIRDLFLHLLSISPKASN